VLNTEITGTKTLLQIGNDADACTAAKEGRLRYDPGGDTWEYCDSAGDWRPFGYCSSNLSTGLVGHWPLDNGSGTTATDVSGNGNDGTLQNMDPATDWITGVIGSYALDFDGADDFVDLFSPGILRLDGSSMTVSAWIRVNSFTEPFHTVVSWGDDTWRLHRAGLSNTIRFGINGYSNPPSGGVSGTTDVTDGQWYHIVGVFDDLANELSIYTNSIRENVSSYNYSIGDTSVSGVRIGHNAMRSGDRHWNGSIDDIRIYNRALSDCEVQALYLGL
jgi:hypothetical protein